MSMRSILGTFAFAAISLPAAHAQSSVVRGQVVLWDDGQPLPYTTVALLSQGTQRLTSDSGTFVLIDLPPGEVRLRFKRIGFVPKDTLVVLAPGETARIRVEMTHLIINLPAVVVSGRCTNETPFEPKPGILAELFDQVNQNAERMTLLATARPFVMRVASVGGLRNPDRPFVPTRVDTVERGALPVVRYEPKRVARRGTGRYAGSWMIHMPELPDFADTAFTNNHCFRYAGQTRFATDSVIAVDFEPVPWLDKDVDIKGTIYLRVDGYQLVALVARTNRMPSNSRHIADYTHQTRFREVVPGIPVAVDWELRNVYRNGSPPFVQTGKVFDIRWTDATPVKVDTARRLH
ncbi:MAG: carboxypeptidase-like regulatory domain-containing protein [Gemmatimonadaceae bacterium]|nr:carboxypeptidase-like regulatory domain-containing protein [Gemmatimonadaceae bacterium]